MRTPREIISSITDDPISTGFIFLIVVGAVVTFNNDAKDDDIREKWHNACMAIGGVPVLDKQHRGIGDSICLKPNSILTVPDYD